MKKSIFKKKIIYVHTYLYMIFVKLSFRTTLLTTKSEFKCDKSILSNSAVKEIRKYHQK